jgi:hypothetical protein
MPQAIHRPIEEAAGNCSCSAPKPASFDFRGKHPLDWDEIEVEIHSISLRATTVEMIGRTARDAVHGDDLTDVFGQVAAELSRDIERLKYLLGLDKGCRS